MVCRHGYLKSVVLSLLVLFLHGCNDDSDLLESTALGVNAGPTIVGSPASAVRVGTTFLFQPTSHDADGDELTFTLENGPAWAQFNPTTGELSGNPDMTDIGTTSNIRIFVSDGVSRTALAPFQITVTDSGAGSITLDWLPPTANNDGSTLTDLASYRIYYGNSPDSLDQSIVVDNPGISSYTVDNLLPGMYYFALTAINNNGLASSLSNIVPKTVS